MFYLIYWQHFCAEIVKEYIVRDTALSLNVSDRRSFPQFSFLSFVQYTIRADLKMQRGGKSLRRIKKKLKKNKQKKTTLSSSLFYCIKVLFSFMGLIWIGPETPTEKSSVITTHSSVVSPWYFTDQTWNIDRDSVCWHIEGGRNNIDFLESHLSPPSHIAACDTMHGRKTESGAERGEYVCSLSLTVCDFVQQPAISPVCVDVFWAESRTLWLSHLIASLCCEHSDPSPTLRRFNARWAAECS